MFNVAVIDAKRIIKIAIMIFIAFFSFIVLKNSNKVKNVDINKKIDDSIKQVYSHSFVNSIDNTISSFKYVKSNGYKNNKYAKFSLSNLILNLELKANKSIVAQNTDEIETNDDDEILDFLNIDKDLTEIKTEVIEEKNITPSYTDSYNSVDIKNRTSYTLYEDMLVPDIEIENKKDIIIYHTHTCESYTPSDEYDYQMTGTYRTTDLNYTVVRVGDELDGYLTSAGYNVIHNYTVHDYPAYSGSYERSYETVNSILQKTNAQVLLDIHRDAVGNGDEYGPTVRINDDIVAQLMIVVGTDAAGLYHPNWRENLKFAIKLQSKANELYPGLFRPISISTSRYNQHLAKGALIIEVGATGNTLDQALNSMKYFAIVLDEILK